MSNDINKADLEDIREAIQDLQDDVDNLVLEINPVLTHDPMELENRLSSLEGKVNVLLTTLIPVGASIVGIFLLLLFG